MDLNISFKSALWIGKTPQFGTCPGVDAQGKIHSLSQINFENIRRQDLLNYFDNSWTLTEVLFSSLIDESTFMRSPAHGLRHPLIFYYAHPAVLYVNKLRLAGLISDPVNSHFEQIFEVGVDEMSWDDMSKNDKPWPSLDSVKDYRRTVYQLICDLILNHPMLDPSDRVISQNTPAWALVMAFEHERIHLETSAVLIRELPLECVHKPDSWPEFSTDLSSRPMHLLKCDPVSVNIGKPLNFPSFGWDNEYGLRQINVPEFEVSNQLISNGEFLNFIKAGGYSDESLWTAEGWRWRAFNNSKIPAFWKTQGPSGLHQYRLRTTFEEIELPHSLPVIVNYHEAQAYCAWMSHSRNSPTPFRLPSEAEHHALRHMVKRDVNWNHNLTFGGENSVSQFESDGIFDLFGNVWQWCADEFNPLPGFKTHPYYEDFSTPCFDGKHHLIMGGSFISTGAECEKFARFHFRPHFYQNAGFRIARSIQSGAKSTAVQINLMNSGSNYESDELLAQYLLLHFAKDKDVFPFSNVPTEALNFPKRCANVLIGAAKKQNLPMNRALDIGCAVGGSSFSLSEFYDEVIGLDLSTRFINAAIEMKTKGFLTFLRKDQGELNSRIEVSRPTSANLENLQFIEGDACNLPPNIGEFDAVLMANLLCRLPDPKSCLESLAKRNIVRKGGLLALVSPYSWLEQHTSRESWLGAQYRSGIRQTSQEVIKNILGPDFELLEEDEFPLLIREHERKYQYIVSHLMLWQRK